MKASLLGSALCVAAVAAAPTRLETRSTVQGFDISHYQANVNFAGAYNSGARFVIIKVSGVIPEHLICSRPRSAYG